MEALHEAALYARVSGYVRRWYADIGTTVRAGQVLAEIDVPELQQNVLQARAQLAQMQSALVLAQSNLERWRLLAADSAVTVQELQQMQQAYDASAASVRAAEANLRGLTSTLQYTQVRAPFAGVVVARNVDNGALITAGGCIVGTAHRRRLSVHAGDQCRRRQSVPDRTDRHHARVRQHSAALRRLDPPGLAGRPRRCGSGQPVIPRYGRSHRGCRRPEHPHTAGGGRRA